MTSLQGLGGPTLVVSTMVLAMVSLASGNITHKQLNMFHMSQRIVTSPEEGDFNVFRIISDVSHQTCAEECVARRRCFAINVPIHFNVCYLIERNPSQSSVQPEVEAHIQNIYGIKHEWPKLPDYQACNCPYNQTCVLGQSGPTCKITECGLPEVKPNATYLGNIFAVNTKIAYKCQGNLKMNYQWESSNIAVCREDGVWNTTAFTCTVCHDGYHGMGCTQLCHCLEDRICDHVTGGCPNDECAYGWIGKSCNKSQSLSRGMKVTLSSTFTPGSFMPEFAVDGKRESKSRPSNFCLCCAATVYQANPWLRVDLGREYQIQSVQVYGRDLPPESYNKVEIYLHVDIGHGEVLRIINTNTIFINETFNNYPARYVTLLQRKIVLLTVCEIEVYGVCPNGSFGHSCNRTCHCAGPPCDKEGKCSGGCVQGYTGDHCETIDIGFNCTENITCTTNFSFCNPYRNTCTCDVGYSYDPRNHSCVEECEDYGNDFTRVNGFIVDSGGQTKSNVSTADACEEECNGNCKSYTLKKNVNECILYNFTLYTGSADIIMYESESVYGTKNCMSD